MTFDRVCVVGMGYIGLPTAAVIASRGVHVIGIDVVPAVVESINRGEVHFIEPDLDAVVQDVVSSGRLRAAVKPEPADAFILAVPTPFNADHTPDLSYVEAAARAIAPVLQSGNVVILESTSPVGTTEMLAGWLADARPDLTFPAGNDEPDVLVAYCPERVLPGHMMRELVQNDRIVGGITPACAKRATELYKLFVQGECLETNARTAEMCKLTENSFRDVNIAFANELSLVSDRLGIDVWELIRLANRHPRVNILQPGPGVGGHCIAVDPWFIVSSAPDLAHLIRTAREVNDGKPGWVLNKVKAAIAEAREGSTAQLDVAVLGLSFKADIDDLRESPALTIAKDIGSLDGIRAHFVEPNIDTLPPRLQGLGDLVSVEAAIGMSSILVLLVDHAPFKALDRSLFDGKRVIDTRGIWSL